MNLFTESHEIWADAYERARLGDTCWWALAFMSVPTQTARGVVMRPVLTYFLYARSPIVGQGPIGATVPIENPLAVLDQETADWTTRTALEQLRATQTQLISMNG